MNKTLALVLALVFALGAVAGCSDDDKQGNNNNNTTPDAAVLDQSLQGDKGTGGDGKADGPAADRGPDQAVGDLAPDLPLTPDLPPTSTNWAAMSPRPTQKLHAINGKSATEVYAVGEQGLLMKYNGTSWSTMTNPDTNKTKLTDVHINKDYVYAFGSQVILYLSGSTWTSGYIPSYSSTYYNFIDVWGPTTSSTKIGVGDMGYYMSYQTSGSPSSSWSSIYFGSSKLSDSMYSVWGSDVTEVFVVGDNGGIWQCKNSSSCAQYSTTGWSQATAITTNHLRGVWGADSSNVFAVGLSGTILKYNGSSWTKMTTNTYSYFYGVWGASATDVWAVGHPIFKQDESIFHYNGTSWTKVPPPGQPYLNAIWGADKDNVFVVGNNDILRLKLHP